MIIKNNIFNISEEKVELVDSKNNKYLVTFENGFTHIFNNKPINLLSKLNKLHNFGTYRIELLNESINETQTIINNLKDMI